VSDNALLRTWNLAQITEGCAEATSRYLHRLASDARFCFELMRRAFGERLDEALASFYQTYLPLLTSRARRHRLFDASSGDAEYFARVALANFYRVCSGEAFLAKFNALPGALAYLYSCLHSVIVQDVRDNPPEAELDDERAATGEYAQAADVSASDLWAHIRAVLADADDEQLAWQRFVLEMKPAEIVRASPGRWASEREVSVALQRIRRHLRADATLRDLMGEANTFSA